MTVIGKIKVDSRDAKGMKTVKLCFFSVNTFYVRFFLGLRIQLAKKPREDGNMKFLDCINRRRSFMYLKLYISD